jgi:hypothetical protein
MNNYIFYPNIWQTFPFSVDSFKLDANGKCIKDMVVKNAMVTDEGISEMTLNIKSFSAIDHTGAEHFITEFPDSVSLEVKGMHAGFFIRSASVLLLGPGSYTTFRFYLGKYGNSFIYSDGLESPADGFDFLDFQIQGGLRIKGGEAPEAILRFDLAPFESHNILRALRQYLKISRLFPARLANSHGQ